jgi:hypothetical protein
MYISTGFPRTDRLLKHLWLYVLPLLLATPAQGATLTGYAELPADTFIPGPTSGRFIDPANDRTPPFTDLQPIQGFSALLRNGDGSYLAISDNGFATRDNSSDYLLCVYVLEPDLRTADGGTGVIHVTEIVRLSDPARHMPGPITREEDRLLTGADLDPESFRLGENGSLWVGEEFYPALLHFSASGRLLAPPHVLEGLVGEDNPMGLATTLPRSRGFEGMAQSPDERLLYPMLEGELSGGEAGLNIYTFDSRAKQFVNAKADEPSYRYRLDDDATAIGDFTMYSETAGLVIERDSGQGDGASLKRVYGVDFNEVDKDGFLVKTLIADLLDIADPDDLNQDGLNTYGLPSWTIEGLAVINATTIAVVNDNNFPFGAARGVGPENTEMILLKIPPLW